MVWNQQQIKCLERDFPVKTDKEVAQMIGKSPNALRIKAFRLGIRKQTALIRESLELNEIEKQFIIGGLLGDLHCRITYSSVNPRLEAGHSAQQKQYLVWKTGLVPRLMFKLRKSKKGSFFSRSSNFKALHTYYNYFYHQGFKSVNREILDQLNELGLLIWYLDDGSYSKRDKRISLYTNCFPFEEQLLIKKWFNEKHSINPHIYSVKQPDKYPGKIWYFLSFRVKDSEKLIELFQKFEIPDCMNYKLGQNSYSTTLGEVGEPSSQLVKVAEKTTERKEK